MRASTTQPSGYGHDVPFTQVVDRRVSNLGEALLQEGEDAARPAREWWLWRVVAHRRCRLGAGGCHWPQHDRYLFFRVARADTPRRELGPSRCQRFARRSRLHGASEPFAVGSRSRLPTFEDFVPQDPTRFGIDREHLARAEPPALDGSVAGRRHSA